MKSYILWDHDGVLVDTEPLYFEATARVLQTLGVTLELATYLEDMAEGRSAWERAQAHGLSSDEVEVGRRRRDELYQRLLLERDIDVPDAPEVLGRLARDYAMAIVTTAKRTDFDLIHRNRNIVPHMRFVLASGDYARAKPAPDPYLEALRRFGAKAPEALVVEDSERGLRAAVAAGIDCVVVSNAFVSGQDLSAAKHRVDSLSELPDLLASL